MFWEATLSESEREITRSLTALKTLRFEGGRVSIDPEEVLLQPGYLAARRAAGKLIQNTGRRALNWDAVDEASLALLGTIEDEDKYPSPGSADGEEVQL